MRDWTNAQKAAILAKDSDILVSAAAGSGKTAVLVQRVIEKITSKEDNTNLDELLVVTFTNAAAAEMKTRIENALGEILANNPYDSNAIKQMSMLSNAKISTIDAFCGNLVRENFFLLDIEQDFKILDDAQALLVEDNAINKVIDELYKVGDPKFKSLVELLSSSKSDAGFIEAIKKINTYIMVQAFPFDWLDSLAEGYNPKLNIEDSAWGSYMLEQLDSNLDYAFKLLDNSRKALTIDDCAYDKLDNIINSDLLIFMKIREAKSWDEIVDACANISYERMVSRVDEFSAKKIIAKNRDLYKEVLEKDIVPFFTTKSDDFKAENEYLYPIIKLLAEIVKQYNAEMLEIKKELNSYTFSDIQHFAIDLLFTKDENGNIIKTDIAKQLENSYKEILVDEYQDTNYAQDKLFETLSNGHNRFMVGDVKQSIYRFRLAMPQIFTDKKNAFDAYPTDFSLHQRIILDQNFRSREGICGLTNFIFSKLMSEKVGELKYTTEEYLNNGAKYLPTDIPSAQMKIVTLPKEENVDEYEAKQVASLILDKINNKEQIKDGDSYRDVCFSDFALLFRAASTRMPIFRRVFAEYGIPVIANNKLNLFESNEVSILVSLLRTIDNPSLDIPLLATLMSVFYGYSADDISSARVKTKAKNLYGSISNDENFSKFIDDLNRYRKYAASMSVESFIRQIIAETSYLSVISAMGNAEQRKLNVMKLVELAKSYDNGENVGLTAFIRYVDSIMKAKVNVESASVNNASTNAVTLTTIHGSKGLEYPICIFVGTNHAYNKQDNSSLVQLNPTYGIGVKVHNEEGLYRYNSAQYNCIKDINSTAGMSENLRVLYVAITRAKEQFITFITHSNPEKRINEVSKKIVDNKIAPEVVKHISSDADMMLLCALLHKDADELRQYAESDITPDFSFDFDWSFDFIDELSETEVEDEIKAEADEKLVAQIADKLSYKYDRCDLSSFSSLRVASQLDEKNNGFKYLATSRPAFLNKASLTPAQKGTAMHKFMEHCDYKESRSNLDTVINDLINRQLLTEEEANCLDKAKLNIFFNSKLMYRMINSDNIHREIKVSTFIPVCELENTDYTDEVLVRGVADCVFEENGELVLVDYKTDRVENESELLERYQNQLSFYKKAIERKLEKPVKQALLYSFWLNKECIYK